MKKRVMKKSLSVTSIEKALTRLADPEVNTEVDLASSLIVAKDIIHSLPGVKRLRRDGPKVSSAVLNLLARTDTLKEENLTSIALHILEAYPSEDVKLALAPGIVARWYLGFNTFLAAETFLKAAGIRAKPKDVIAVAQREAKKIVDKQPPKIQSSPRPAAQVPKPRPTPSPARKPVRK